MRIFVTGVDGQGRSCILEQRSPDDPPSAAGITVTFAAETTFKISRPRLRLRKKRHLGADPDQLSGQLQFGQCRLPHTIVVMGEPTDKTGQPKVTRLICAVPMKRRPSIFEVAREAEFFPFPAGNRFTMPIT